MKYVIDDQIIAKSDLSLHELLLLLYFKAGGSLDRDLQNLRNREALVDTFVTPRWSDVCDKILLDSDKTVPTESQLEALAEKLRDIFPQGKKEGTPYYWKCNKREIFLKLRSFFALYKTKYSEEEILDAARKYVESFHGDYRYMRLLKYFIWKKEGGLEVSDLATVIDNKDQADNNGDWACILR